MEIIGRDKSWQPAPRLVQMDTVVPQSFRRHKRRVIENVKWGPRVEMTLLVMYLSA
jgi:hypothetical protein